MKKQMLAMVAGAVLLSSSAFGAVYTFDSTVSNWYGDGKFVAAGNATDRLDTKTSDYHDNNYSNMIFVCGNDNASTRNGNIVLLFQNDWAGAQWQAPEGEMITQITITYSFRTDSTAEGMGVFGSGVMATEKEYATVFDGASHFGQTLTVDFDAADQVTLLQLRAFWQVGTGTGFVGVDPISQIDNGHYNGNISAVTITTALIPEPATFALLGMGALLLSKKRK